MSLSNWRKNITKGGTTLTGDDFKSKPLFTPSDTYYRHGYDPAGLSGYLDYMYKFCEPIPAGVTPASIRLRFVTGTNRTRIGIAYCDTFDYKPIEPYVKNMNILNNNEYSRLIGNLFDVISLYFIEERPDTYRDSRFNLGPILHELETNPQFIGLWYEGTTDNKNITSHNLNGYYGEFVKGDKVNIKGNFNIGMTPDKIATLNNTQIVDDKYEVFGNNYCYWYVVPKFGRRYTSHGTQQIYPPFFIHNLATSERYMGSDPSNIIIDNDMSHLTHFEYSPGHYENAWDDYAWESRYDKWIIWYPYYPDYDWHDYCRIRNYPVWTNRCSWFPDNVPYNQAFDKFAINMVQIAVPKNSRSKITERKIFTPL